MDTIYIIGAVVFGVIALYLAISLYRSKVKISGEAIEQGADKVIEVVETFLNVFDFNDKTERTIQEILQIADSVSEYVAEVLNDKEDKTSVSLAAIDKILAVLDVKPNQNEQELINIVVGESIKFVEDKQK
jgi:phenylpyruvate tautomerase PptA (4-oxalocrotonate tautomerase family)